MMPATVSAALKFGGNPPLSADSLTGRHSNGAIPSMMRTLQSPAFPPGLFPTNSNSWMSPVSNAPPGFGTPPGVEPKKVVTSVSANASTSSAALKQKFANLIADSRADATKDAAIAAATARVNGGTPVQKALSTDAVIDSKSSKPVEPVDFVLLNDIPGWFRSMRLHKYTSLFEGKRWQDIVKMDEEALVELGVAALGARRKMMKVFDQVKTEAAAKGVEY